LTQTYNFGAEAHQPQLVGGVMSAFVLLSTAIVQALTWTFVASIAIRKDSQSL